MSLSASSRSFAATPGGVITRRDIPELAEARAALVGRVFAPEELAAELDIDAGEIGLDEALVDDEDRQRVLRDEVDIGDEQPRADVGAAACTWRP